MLFGEVWDLGEIDEGMGIDRPAKRVEPTIDED